MPPRVARASVALSKPTNARKKSQKRTLDAFSIASHSAPDKLRIPQHRLGESDSFEPRQKRRRLQDDDEDDNDEEHASNARRLQQKNVTKTTGTGRAGGLDEEFDEGSDSEGNEWRMGGHIGEDSDSSLDSDEAFGESDDDRFEGFNFRGSSTNKNKNKNKQKKKQQSYPEHMDLDEGNENADSEEDDDFGDEGVDLATMLDESNDDFTQTAKKPSKSTKDMSDDEEEEEEEDDDDDDEDDDEESESEPSEAESDDDDDPLKLSKLQDLVASLEKDQPEKRIVSRTQDVHESQQPSAYGLSASQKLKISDLLPTVTDPALRKSLKLLSSDKPSKRSGVPGKLHAPLPKRQQDRLDRTVATQKAKETLDRWRDTVVHNRRAEFLQFPLKDPNASEPIGTNKMVPTQQDKPQNDLENAIQNILEESGLSRKQEDQIQQFEELQMNKIPLEEVTARRAELRKARELLFREEVKAKRVKKIKSKAYRRVHRKERERAEATERALQDAAGIEPDEDDKERMDRRRAEERMGAKHKESKWAKGMKKSGRSVWDDEARDGLIDMARRNEELRRRIEGKDVHERDDDDSDISISDDDDEDEDMDDEKAEKAHLSKKLDKLGAKDEGFSKLGNMAFMKKAEAARKAQNDEDIESIRRELADEEASSEDETETTVGRRTFGPKAKDGASNKQKPARGELEENPASDEEDQRNVEDEAEIIVDRPVNTKSATQSKKPRSFLKSSVKVVPDVDEPTHDNEENAWVTGTKSKKRSKKQTDDQVLDLSKPAPSQQKPSGKQAKPVETNKPAVKESTAPSTEGWTTVPYGDDNEANEEKTMNPILSEKDNQSKLHQRAFAGDDVAVDFEAEKADQMQDEDDKVESNFLPGWGSWAGEGLSKATKKHNKRIAHNPLLKNVTEGVKAANRKDAKLKNVVISEAQQRKGKKYLASNLPHQFEKTEQYERSLRIPVGPEWTTKETFQRNTRPRVVVKQGIVAPMEKPLF